MGEGRDGGRKHERYIDGKRKQGGSDGRIGVQGWRDRGSNE